MKTWTMLAMVLVVVGAVNWGLVGLFDYNLVHAILGFSMTVEKLVYILVGLSGLWVGYTYWTMPKKK